MLNLFLSYLCILLWPVVVCIMDTFTEQIPYAHLCLLQYALWIPLQSQFHSTSLPVVVWVMDTFTEQIPPLNLTTRVQQNLINAVTRMHSNSCEVTMHTWHHPPTLEALSYSHQHTGTITRHSTHIQRFRIYQNTKPYSTNFHQKQQHTLGCELWAGAKYTLVQSSQWKLKKPARVLPPGMYSFSRQLADSGLP